MSAHDASIELGTYPDLPGPVHQAVLADITVPRGFVAGPGGLDLVRLRLRVVAVIEVEWGERSRTAESDQEER